MEYKFGNQELQSRNWAGDHCVLLTNGLGGYASVTEHYGVNRCDQGLLIGALRAPNVRQTLVHRMKETLQLAGKTYALSAQEFGDGSPAEDGNRYTESFCYEYVPCWCYEIGGVKIRRQMAMAWERNTVALRYTIENHAAESCTLVAEPFVKFASKEQARKRKLKLQLTENRIYGGGSTLYIQTDADLSESAPVWQWLAYPEDRKDGRWARGLCGSCCRITRTIAPGEMAEMEILFSGEPEREAASQIIEDAVQRQKALETAVSFRDPLARQLVRSADAYISRRDSTGGKTILAGYPLFSDWGRDTMIALPGCVLATGRYEDARSILRTFLAYERDGLVPNLFPEGDQPPMYNTVDAALLLIDGVWQYLKRTEDLKFARESWPVLERIAAAYQKGTHHGIRMDEDCLIQAGEGLDQVTWMDVCVQGILPTPRHGKPVEINAYWYNALRILENLGKKLGMEYRSYGQLADQVKDSFIKRFYMPNKGYLKDVISGTNADDQIRCNQIWAVAMDFTMLSPEQERQVVDTVRRHLYTPFGLRTLSPEDPEYRGFYGGDQLQRDLAYHQGTTWVFPLGAYYRAWLKVRDNAPEAARAVRSDLQAVEVMLREGCLGQLPEIYDGDEPREGKGCFAQAWSVGEMLRVFETVENILKEDS